MLHQQKGRSDQSEEWEQPPNEEKERYHQHASESQESYQQELSGCSFENKNKNILLRGTNNDTGNNDVDNSDDDSSRQRSRYAPAPSSPILTHTRKTKEPACVPQVQTSSSWIWNNGSNNGEYIRDQRRRGPQQTPHVNLDALRQWSSIGKVKGSGKRPQHKKYRLGRWHSVSTSSWNPPGSQHTTQHNTGDSYRSRQNSGIPGSNNCYRASQFMRSAVSVDISYKPSESPRHSFHQHNTQLPNIIVNESDNDESGSCISVPKGGSENSDDNYDDEYSDSPLTQLLLRENDEIWNNKKYRFTFYSPVTGTIRSIDVKSLRTDNAEGLDELMRVALGDKSSTSDNRGSSCSGPHGKSSIASEYDNISLEERRGEGQTKGDVAFGNSGHQCSLSESTKSPNLNDNSNNNEFLHPNDALFTRHPRQEHSLSSSKIGKKPLQQQHESSASSENANSGRLFWLDITDPTDDEIFALSKVFDLHPLTTEELLLLKSNDSPLQDSHKSFRYYDIICYRTSASNTHFSKDLQDAESDIQSHDQSCNNRSQSMRPLIDSIIHRTVSNSSNRVSADEKESPSVHVSTFMQAGPAQTALGNTQYLGEESQLEKIRSLLGSLFKSNRNKDNNTNINLASHPNIPIPEINLTSPSNQSQMPSRSGRFSSAERSYPSSQINTTQTQSNSMSYDTDDFLEEPLPFYTIILPNGIITLHNTNIPHIRNTVARLMLDEDTITLTPDYVAYLLLDDITDTLVPTTRLLELEVDAVDELVLILTEAEHDDILKRIGIERRHALWLVRLLHGKAEVVRAVERRLYAKVEEPNIHKQLYLLDLAHQNTSNVLSSDALMSPGDVSDDGSMSQILTSDEEEGYLYERVRRRDATGIGARRISEAKAHPQLSAFMAANAGNNSHPDVSKYLADVHDHLLALTASVHHCERILARAHGNYLARINLEMTHASNTTNQLATQITVLASIFLPLNLVAGLWGMNVKVPGRDRNDLRDFAIIVSCMAAFAILTLAFCRWKRLI